MDNHDFKVGDRVRIKSRNLVSDLVSDEGVIVSINNSFGIWPIDVLFDGHETNDECPCDPWELILLERGTKE